MRFSGSYVPLVTPFDRKGRVDRKALQKLIEWHIAEGTDGIVCSGTTGEGLCLSEAERKKVLQISIQTAAGRFPTIACIWTSDTRTSIRSIEDAKKLGASGCLVITPYYIKPSQRGCVLHFTEVAKVGLPVIVYHNPSRAAVRLSAETVQELACIPNIVAIKDSSSDLEFLRKIVRHIDVFSGDDQIAFEILQEGAVGTIASTANLIPRGWKRMVSLCLQKKWDEAKKIATKYLPFCKAIFLETNPQGLKFALHWLGRCQPILRSPMILPSEATQLEIKKALLRLALPHFLTQTEIRR